MGRHEGERARERAEREKLLWKTLSGWKRPEASYLKTPIRTLTHNHHRQDCILGGGGGEGVGETDRRTERQRRCAGTDLGGSGGTVSPRLFSSKRLEGVVSRQMSKDAGAGGSQEASWEGDCRTSLRKPAGLAVQTRGRGER